ncbi:MAG: DDE-type integrase/transposase/recombinase, partial [Nitrososphaera sp.]
MTPYMNSREERANLILKDEKAITRIDAQRYFVKSQSGKGEYEVISSEFGFGCSCPDHLYRGLECKHVLAVKFSLELRKTVASQVTIKPIVLGNCPRCKSEQIVREGIRHNKKSGDIQRYSCRDCKGYFTMNAGFEGMHAIPQLITSAIQLYFSGESFRNVQKFLRLQGLKVSHQTVYNWIQRYVGLMEGYLNKITPNVSNTWRTDELFLKVKGNTKYLYALMDDETRFWIAQQVADRKYTEDVRPLFRQGKAVAGKKPDMLISDGAPNFHDAYQKEFWSKVPPRTSHVRHIRIQGDRNNNKLERFNGEIRDREKVMRGIKKMDSPILKGY